MKWKVRDWTTGLRSEKLELRTLSENHESQEHFCIHTHDMNDQAQLSVKNKFACVISLLIVLTLMILIPLLMCTMWWYINFISNLHLYYWHIYHLSYIVCWLHLLCLISCKCISTAGFFSSPKAEHWRICDHSSPRRSTEES